MFLHLCVILFAGGCMSKHAMVWGCGHPPPGQIPPGRHPPPKGKHPLGIHPHPETATEADVTHPTGMHACLRNFWISLIHIINYIYFIPISLFLMFFIDHKLHTNSLKTKTRKNSSRICTTRLKTSFAGGNEMREIKQECTPVGCVPPASVAVSPARMPPSLPCTPPPHMPPHHTHPLPLIPPPPPPATRGPSRTEWLTHASENITLPQHPLRTVKSRFTDAYQACGLIS